jgi:cytochrome P450
MTATAPALDDLDIVSNETFADNGYPHAAWTRLRRESPLHYFTRGVKVPFWAVTRHEDIVWVSRQPRRLLNAPRLAVFPAFAPPAEDERMARHLLNMDAPDHAEYRKLASPWFTPRSIRRLQPAIERISGELLDALCADGGDAETDFVTSVAAPLPLSVLAELLGVPRADWNLMFEWTNAIIGAQDPEYRLSEDAQQSARQAQEGLFRYFVALVDERRKRPRQDMVSVLATAKLRGAEVPPFELLSYFLLLVVAGNETTRNATSGGLLALIENPDQLEELRDDPDLLDPAVEEILRWTTPVIQFCRTASEDFERRGQKIRAGDSLCLFYPSANRDEEVFDAPFDFRIDRRPNPHLAFGIGEHFCMGANLARLELRVVFSQLAARIEGIEAAGPVERLRSSFLGGVKHMPIRLRLRPRPVA